MTLDLSPGLDLDSTPARHDLYLQRLANTRRTMVALGVPVMLVRDPFNVRYVTGATNMTVFNLCVPARVSAGVRRRPGDPVRLPRRRAPGGRSADDRRGADAHGASATSAPTASSPARLRRWPARSRRSFASTSGESTRSPSTASRSSPSTRSAPPASAITDADVLMSRTRRVKLPMEIAYMREAMRRTVARGAADGGGARARA